MPNFIDNLDLIDPTGDAHNVLVQDRNTLALANQNAAQIQSLDTRLSGDISSLSARIAAELLAVDNRLDNIEDALLPFTYFYPQCKPIADGDSHPLSERYSTLEAAQADYSFATSLTDEIDWCALQKYVYYCQQHNYEVLIPHGTFVINKAVNLDLNDGAVSIRGYGNSSQIKTKNNTALFIEGSTGTHVYYGSISDLYIINDASGATPAGAGISFNEVSIFTIFNVLCAGFQIGLSLGRSDHARIFGSSFRWNTIGVYGFSANYTEYTAINTNDQGVIIINQ